MRNRYWALNGNEPYPCTIEKMCKERIVFNWRVALTDVNGIEVSTVFLGLDHNWTEEGPPILFETMIFGGDHDEYQERYATWKEAEVGHEKAVRLVKTGGEDE